MLTTIKIYTNDLEVGMFVSALDRSWLDTPFSIQGFRIENRDQIERLQEYCEYVLVDSHKSKQTVSVLRRKVRRDKARTGMETIFQGRTITPYVDDRNFSEERPMAQDVLDSLVGDLLNIFDQVSDHGKINAVQLKKSVEPLIGSISRNPDACLWVARLKQHDQYTYEHALGAAIWAVSLGRAIGLPRRDLRSLAIGGMLMDVGKLRVDPDILKAERALTRDEMQKVQTHVAFGVEIIHESGIINQDVIDMVAHHHERFDGSGYPNGLKGDQIPAVARIAGIVDTYGALTSKRSHAAAMSPSNAIRMLYESRDVEFQAELVEAFIKAIGIYPAGTLVELSTGEVAVVVAEYRTRRLRPKVMILLDPHKKQLREPQLLDLQHETGNATTPAPVITRSLEPGAYDIDLSQYAIETTSLPH